MGSFLRIRFLPALIVSLAGVLLAALYAPGLQGGFFFDDEPSILYAEGVQLRSLSVESLQEALSSGRSGPSGRPLAQLSFALNYYFSGFNPFVFKATNLAIHAVGGLLVFWLALRLFAAAGPGMKPRQRTMLSGLLAALWLLHPIQLTPILHVVQRMTSLSALFLLSALLLHVRAREDGGRSGWLYLMLAWGVLWPLSCLSKESGALFPCFALAWELIVRRAAQGRLDRFARAFAVLAGLTFLGLAIYLALPAGRWLWAGYDFRPFTLAERLLTEGRVLWFYLSLILLPRLGAFGLYHDDIAVSAGLLDPWTTLPAWAGLIGLAWLAWRARDRMPLMTFGIAWFFIGHLLESTVLPLEIAHEHRNYLPLFGVLLAVIAGLAQLAERARPARLCGLGLAAAALVCLPLDTGLRAWQFGDELRRTQAEVLHHPGSARAHYDAGRALIAQVEADRQDAPAYAQVRAHFERAGELDPAFKFGWLGLMYLNCRAGLGVEQRWVDELAHRLRHTPFGPADATALLMLKALTVSGRLCLDRGGIEQLFEAAVANPTAADHLRADMQSWLADYYALHARDLRAAEVALERARAITPYNPVILLQQVQLDYLQGRRDEAGRLLDIVEKLPLRQAQKALASDLRYCLGTKSGDMACTAR